MIEVLIGAPLLLTAAGLTYAAARSRRRAHLRTWREAARHAGLRDVLESWWSTRMSGMAGSHRVDFDRYQRGKEEDYESGTRIVVRGDSGLTLRPEVVGDFEQVFGVREIELGDSRFDHAAWVLGAEEMARALLDAETRGLVLELLGGAVRVAGTNRRIQAKAWIESGNIRAELPGSQTLEWPETLAGALTTLLNLARRLQPPADLVGRIAANTRREPEWEVRLRNLSLLAGSYPRHNATREALRFGCEDEREEVQTAAALALDDDQGRRTLLEIASREWSDDSCAARAVTALRENLPPERVLAILTHALRTRRVRTAGACLAALGQSGGPAAVDPLAKVLAVENGALGVAAAQALGASREEQAERPLLRALPRAPAAVRVAVAEALGRVGSARAVLPLKDVADGGDSDAPLRRAARQAVAEIQSRLQGASPGQLSLADGDAGQLSLADEDPRGRVSIAKPGTT